MFFIITRNNELAALFDRDVVLATEIHCRFYTGFTKLRIEAAGSVVNTSVYDAAVTPSLMLRKFALFLE